MKLRLTMIRGLLVYCALLAWQLPSAFAYEIPSISLTELVRRSDTIAHVEVVAANPVQVGRGGKTLDCGYIYDVRVVEQFSGAERPTLRFKSADSLTIGSEYVVFASLEDRGSMRRFLAMGKNDQDAVRECTRGEPALYVSAWHGEALEFDYVGEALDQKRWLKSQEDSVLVPSSVSRRRVSFATAEIPDAYADFYSFTALSWDEFRMAVLAAVSEAGRPAQRQK